MITGSLVALITPMFENGDIDYNSYRALIDWHIEQKTDAIIVTGTSGESSTISVDEHCELVKVAVEHAHGRVPIIAGAGGNSTKEAVILSKFAHKVGVTATLQVVPYYNKPTQEGLYQHFKTIAEQVGCDVILYNVPGRTITDLSNETTLRLAQIPNIIGIKDATGDIGRGIALIKEAPDDFAIYSGDDSTAAALILMGAHGNISVTANVAPKMMHDLCQAALNKDIMTTRKINNTLLELNKQLFIEANPIPIKWALHTTRKIPLGTRLPLTPLSSQAQPIVRNALKTAGLI